MKFCISIIAFETVEQKENRAVNFIRGIIILVMIAAGREREDQYEYQNNVSGEVKRGG